MLTNNVISIPKLIDADSLAIVDLIKKHFQTLSLEVGPVGNIYTIFMHDLTVHFSGIQPALKDTYGGKS